RVGGGKGGEGVKGGKITSRLDKVGKVQALIGKVVFEVEKVVENFKAVNDGIVKENTSTVKGTYTINWTLSTTQGGGIKGDPN
ncbi:50S ribosomal protein L1, partial [Streptococcus thoraltensis]